MHNFDCGDLIDQSGLQSLESDYRLDQDSERQTPRSNVITSLYNLLDPLELFCKGLSRSKDRQTFNSIKLELPAADYTKESSDQKTLTDNTSECSTETKESVGENVNDGLGLWRVNQITGWPDKNGEVTDASSNSECHSPSPDTNYSGFGSPPGTGSGSWEPLPDDDSMNDQSNESTDPSDSGSEGARAIVQMILFF